MSALTDLARTLPRLEVALTMRDRTTAPTGFVTGGAPSWELISLGVEAVLSEIRRGCDEWEDTFRLYARPYWHRPTSRRLPERLAAFVAALDAAPDALADLAEGLDRQAAGWQRRAAVVLGEAWAPYGLLWPSGAPVGCPVVGWAGTSPVFRVEPCTGVLRVHRDDDTGTPARITCKADRTHTWAAGPDWLRLGRMLAA